MAFGTLTPKACTRKVLNAFGVSMAEQNIISKLIPDSAETLQDALQSSSGLIRYKNRYSTEFEVIDRLQGIISHEGQHAGGIIIYPNISNYLPIKSKAEDRKKRIVAFDKYMLEDLGFFKFDVLGLETLPIVKRCLESIERVEGVKIDLTHIDLEDKNVYDMLSKGYVSGVFQLNNQAQKIIEQQPRNFRDLIAINALIRPGTGDWGEYIARRKGKEWSVLEQRRPYLEETEGLITYQEQFLLDAKMLAGWDIAYADKHIRKNKNIKADEELRSKFYHDCAERGFEAYDIQDIWKEIEHSVDGGYSFNKSHSASYAMLSYQTAWLKYYYPKHFFASVMTSEKADSDGQSVIANYIVECKSLGIPVLPPDINLGNEDFGVGKDGITYRITAITHVGESAIKSIQKMRPITSFKDFMERRIRADVRQNVVVNLIKAGCFDFDNPNRAELLWQADMLNRTNKQIKEDFQCERYEYNDIIKSKWERDALGMYLSCHPMEKYGFKPLNTFRDGDDCLQGGEVYEVKEFMDKNKNDMAFVFINTLYGNVKVLAFASAWDDYEIREACKIDNTILVKGRRSGDAIILNKVEVLGN